MKNARRIVSTMMALFMFATMFASCGGQEKETPVKKTVQTQDSKDDGRSWKKDTSPVTLDWYQNISFNYIWNDEAPILKKLFDETGVKINWIQKTGTGDDKLITMIASNSLPDILTLDKNNNAAQKQQLEASGMLLPINKLSQQYAPELIQKRVPKSMQDWYKAEDGNLYGIINFWWAPETLAKDTRLDTNMGTLVRKDLMEQAGIKQEDFSTQDGFVNALKKFKDANIKYNGQNVAPLYFSPEGGVNFTLNSELPAMFGIPREDKNGNLIHKVWNEDYKEVVAFANRLFREGVLAKESFTTQTKELKEKWQAGTIFCYLGNISDLFTESMNLNKTDAKVFTLGVGPIKSKVAGREPRFESTGMTGWLYNSIPKTTKKADRVVRFFDYMASEEGQILGIFGIEGITYEKGQNGRLKWNEKYLEEKSVNNEKAKQKFGAESLLNQFKDPILQDRLMPLPQNVQEIMREDIRAYFRPFRFNETCFNDINPAGGTEEAVIYTEIENYYKKEIVKAVLAESEEKAVQIFANMQKEIDKMGWKKVYKVMNDNFQNNKKKVGIQFAWPDNQKK